MQSHSENRNNARRSRGRGRLPHVCFCGFLWLGAVMQTPAQVPTSADSPATKVQVTVTTDPLRRETPRRAVIGLLTYEARGDYATAARYLESATDSDMVQLATEMHALRPYASAS
jgi:hypothetical protein